MCILCKFGEVLWHIVCHDGLLVEPHKITTITIMPTPINVMEINWFLKAVSFYQQYFRDFSYKVAPMCKLLKKDEKFIWTKACAKSWQWMKAYMLTCTYYTWSEVRVSCAYRCIEFCTWSHVKSKSRYDYW
jgi:hypothetical protein